MRKLFLLNLLFLAGVTLSCSSDDDGSGGDIEIPAVESATLDINSGGSTQPNQVYIDLSAEQTTVVRRDAWELGFYSGSENRVFLNSSILVSAAELKGFTDLDQVSLESELKSPLVVQSLSIASYPFVSSEVTVNTVAELLDGLALGYEMYGNVETGISFTDSKEGRLDETAIAPISLNPEENNVYLVSLGSEIPTQEAEPGAINPTGQARGVYKIRVFMDGDSYVLQYAPFDADDYQEAVIAKDNNFNLVAFSLANGTITDVEPPKDNWDLNYTSVHSFYGSMAGMFAGLSYTDYAMHNTLNGVGLYTVFTESESDQSVTDIAYEDFTVDDVVQSNFIRDDRTVIASDWRSTEEGVKNDRYYVLQDAEGNYYKLRFSAMLSASGERGHPQIQYELLQ